MSDAATLLRLGHYREALAQCTYGSPEHALATCHAGDLAEAEPLIQAGLATGERRAEWLHVSAVLGWQQGHAAASGARARQLLEVVAPGDPLEVDGLLLLAGALSQLGDRMSLLSLVRRAQRAADRLGDAVLVGRTRLDWSVAQSYAAPAEALASLAEARQAFAEMPYWQARCLLPRPVAERASPERTLELLTRAEAVFVACGDRYMATLALVGAARAYRQLGRVDEAEDCSERALGAARPHLRLLALYGLDQAAGLRGDVAARDALVPRMLAEVRDAHQRVVVAPSVLGAAARAGDTAGVLAQLRVLERFREVLPSGMWSLVDELATVPGSEGWRVRLAAAAFDRASPEERPGLVERLQHVAQASWWFGPLQVRGALGRGGMATVWSVEDAGEPGAPKAFKVLVEGEPDVLLREVRAATELAHPHVVEVLGHGITPPSLAAQSGGRIPAGRPWMLMPALSGGSLAQRRGQLPWPQVRKALHELLDALGYAHAAGFLHLDVKSDNVLLTDPSDRFEVRLADFGLARAIDPEQPGRVAGTPAAMAPEQWRGDVRWWGPATDLYAVGVLTYELVTGQRPFRGTVEELEQAHLTEDPPELIAVVGVPAGLDAWVRRLLAKDPRDRFATAAAARWALDQLGEPVATPGGLASNHQDVGETIDFGWSMDEEPGPAASPSPARAAPSSSLIVRPPFPERLPAEGDVGMPEAALAALRPVPVVGRRHEQASLWALVGDVVRDGQPRGAALVGEQGLGGRRLARWLRRAVAGTGAVQVLRAELMPAPGPNEGLGGMTRRLVRAEGLEGESLARWLAVTPWRPADLTVDALHAALDADAAPEAALPVVTALARSGPLLLVIESLHEHQAVLSIVERLLATSLPVAVLVTSRPNGAERLPADMVRHDLKRLSEQHAAALADSIVPLVVSQRDALVERYRGHPGRIVATLRDWARREVWVEEGTRYRVPASELEASAAEHGALPIVPQAMGDVWRALAVLGGRAPQALVTRLLAERGLPPPDLGSVLHVQWANDEVRLAEHLTDRVLADLRRRGDAPAWQLAAAQVLEGDEPLVLARRGRHLLAAGRPLEAAEVLLQAASSVSLAVATSLFAEWEDAMHAAVVPIDDPRWIAGWAAELRRPTYTGIELTPEAQRRIDEVIRRGDAAQRSVARFAWATHHMMSGRTDAIETLEEVMRDPRASTEVRARSALWLAYHHLHRGDRDEVRAMLALGGSLAAGRDDLRLMGAQLMGKLLQQEGRTAEALEVLGQAAAAAPSWRDGAESLRHVYAVLGDVHKELGQLDQAEEAYRRGLVLNRSFADAHQYIDELNLVILAVYRDRLSAFHSRLPGLRADLARTQPEHIVRFVDLVQLLVPGQGAPLNHVVDRIEEVVVVNGWRDVELAALCREVGASLARQGREADAARLERLASLVA